MASAEPPARRSAPARAGVLQKWTQKKAGPGRWEDRFFTVGPTGSINWYKKEGGKISGSVFLQGCSVESEASDPLVLILKTETKQYRLRGSDLDTVKGWEADLLFYTEAEA